MSAFREFDNFFDAFDACREAHGAIVALINGQYWKLFPYGRSEHLEHDYATIVSCKVCGHVLDEVAK